MPGWPGIAAAWRGFIGLIPLCLAIDARRPAAWAGAAIAAAAATPLVASGSPESIPAAVPAAVCGFVAAAVAAGEVPRSLVAVGGAGSAWRLPAAEAGRFVTLSAVRLAWPLAGCLIWVAWRAAPWAGGEPEAVGLQATVTTVVIAAVAAGVGIAGGQLAGLSAADAVSATLLVGLASSLVTVLSAPAGLLTGLAGLLLMVVAGARASSIDTLARAGREGLFGGILPAQSPFRRWLTRAVMAGAVLAMAGWLLSPPPAAEAEGVLWYGLAGGVAVAALAVPHLLLADGAASGPRQAAPGSREGLLVRAMSCAAIFLWPLAVASLFEPGIRRLELIVAAVVITAAGLAAAAAGCCRPWPAAR